MGYLLLSGSIFFSTLMVALFKEIERFRLNLLPVITFNYLFCALWGTGFSWSELSEKGFPETGFLGIAAITGGLFTINYLLMGVTTRHYGLGFTAIITKMALVIPVIFSVLVYAEEFNWVTGIGIGLALAAIYLINRRPGEKQAGSGLDRTLWAVVALFLSSGATDAAFKTYNQEFNQFSQSAYALFSFGSSFLICLLLLGLKAFRQEMKLTFRDFAGGAVLGTANFLSLLFFTKTLAHFEGPVVFPLNHIGIVVVASLIAVLFYKEKFNAWNYLGMALTVAAILLLLW